MPKFYLTTAIDYSNGDPHLGHALEKVGADCIARWRRLRGDDVHFLMGMDEHSLSVIAAAARAGVTPQAWVDRMSATFADYWKQLHTSPDDWIRTSEPRHARAVTTLLQRIRERRPDDLYVAEYEGLYCTGCEEFKQDAQIVDGRCIEHPTLELVRTKEQNHFFRLTAWRDTLLERIRSGTFPVEPAIRRNEVLRLLESGLHDVSISRQRQGWGIPFPGDAGHTVYVWFDALINYLSATGWPDAGHERLWPADLHIIGKGITRFHCIIWPAMLLAAGVALPRRVWAHGYVQWEGAKMSKSAGTAVSLATAIARHGADALRYFLLREVGFEGDGNFTWQRFDARYTADLADTLGNFVSRAISMVHRYRGGVVPSTDDFVRIGEAELAAYAAALDAYDLQAGADRLIAVASAANKFVEETTPWKLAKDPGAAAALDRVLAGLIHAVARLAVMAYAFVPEKAAAMWRAIGMEKTLDAMRFDDLPRLTVAGRILEKPPILFPKPAPAD